MLIIHFRQLLIKNWLLIRLNKKSHCLTLPVTISMDNGIHLYNYFLQSTLEFACQSALYTPSHANYSELLYEVLA